MNVLSTRFAAVCLGGLMMAAPAVAQMIIPDDAKDTCPVPASEFSGWFAGGEPVAGGWVKPADSVGFPTDNTVCDFYKWGAQMFLWLTSPQAGGLVLDGPSIFTVLPPDSKGVRHLVANNGERVPLRLALRSEKFDDIGEIGQAGGSGVLMSQQKSLVYYGVHVNDVYAYFLTGYKTGHFPDHTVFPRNAGDLKAVENYAAKAFPKAPLEDARALVMELKTSWVEADSVPNAGDYVTIQAEVPAFEPNDDNTVWTPAGTRHTTLALTGIHVVGTVQNHPEFVWATFEHKDNAPDAGFWYTDTGGNLKQQPFSSAGSYTFLATGAPETPANVECMKEQKGHKIVAERDSDNNLVCTGGVVPSNTVRSRPWGGMPDQSSAQNNTLLISVNRSVTGQLASGDVRANYVQVGGIWTSAPSATADAPIPDTKDFQQSDLRGSLSLFNATMETYHQDLNCFVCHQQSADAKNSFLPFQLSHIFSQIASLPTAAGK